MNNRKPDSPDEVERIKDADVIALVPCKRHDSPIGTRCNVRVAACAERRKLIAAPSTPSQGEPCPKCNHLWQMHDSEFNQRTGCAEAEGFHECGCRELRKLIPVEPKEAQTWPRECMTDAQLADEAWNPKAKEYQRDIATELQRYRELKKRSEGRC